MFIYIGPCDSDVKVWEDADFSSNWFPEEYKDNSDMARYRSGFFVSSLGCPVIWKSQLLTWISLISTDSSTQSSI